ncbi:hypothetical protein [Flavivirga rizhaonensis]|uniref:hypothetical protein n=1 Tax=Flavivirga rizhaonensis TaxID=2559571 RepID=UPI0014773EE0|nr:hypothetical protein [Flavivirga rizhaonensis]
MKIFTSHRNVDKEEVEIFLNEIPKPNEFEFINHSTLEATDEIWKNKVTAAP